MKILALESSAKAASVAVAEGDELIAHSYQASGLTHSATLLAMAEDMLKNLNLTMRDIGAVAVAMGPGSFTGVRIGVSAAKGLAWGADIPVCGVSTLEAMVYQYPAKNAVICPVMDARRSQVYNALFEARGSEIIRLTPDRAISAAELTEEARELKKPLILLGDGARLCYNIMTDAGFSPELAPPYLLMQTAAGVALAANGRPLISPDELEPNYLRLSQAERERLERDGIKQ